MNANLNNQIKLQNLTYDDIVQNLSHVCFGTYHLPNNTDISTTVNNPGAFEMWKSRILLKYPLATVSFDPQGIWSRRVIINDPSFIYDKRMFILSKSEVLENTERRLY